MKKIYQTLSFITVTAVMLVSCAKQDANQGVQPTAASPSGLHTYGLLPPNPAHYLNVPVYDAAQIRAMFSGSIRHRDAAAEAILTYSLPTPAVRNQEQIGSCTGFCGTEANEIIEYFAKGNTWGPILSPLYLYYAERVNIEHYRISQDPGAEMVDIPEALQKYGECIESDYAYPVNTTETAGPRTTAYKTAPNSAAVSNALLYKIGPSASNYGMVAQGDTATVKALLRANIPVCMGFNVYDNSHYTLFENLNTTNYTYNPLTSTGAIVSGASLLGGHANIIYGYDDTKKVFLMENSWGTSWGNAGYWYLPYSVFMSSKVVPTGNVYWFTL
ncbi:MAG TPA: C1 family peptidase [Hanamia sp.]|nr:C1 family peptidase [Hanamia sp.]